MLAMVSGRCTLAGAAVAAGEIIPGVLAGAARLLAIS
jgi:hypothetical protein